MTTNFEEPGKVLTYLDLASYLTKAARDLADNPDDWENATLADFLNAWSAWLTDSPGYYTKAGEELPEQPSWADVAGMVLAASMYE